jgi:hypothetical protein
LFVLVLTEALNVGNDAGFSAAAAGVHGDRAPDDRRALPPPEIAAPFTVDPPSMSSPPEEAPRTCPAGTQMLWFSAT